MSNESNQIRPKFFARALPLAVTAGLCCAALGCEDSVSYTHIGAPSPALVARPVDQVEVFLATPPARPHRNLGVLQVGRAPFSADRSMNDTVQVARASAGAMGCEAILVTSIDVLGGRNRPANVQATCIVYTGPATSEPSSPPVSTTAAAPESR